MEDAQFAGAGVWSARGEAVARGIDEDAGAGSGVAGEGFAGGCGDICALERRAVVKIEFSGILIGSADDIGAGIDTDDSRNAAFRHTETENADAAIEIDESGRGEGFDVTGNGPNEVGADFGIGLEKASHGDLDGA